MYDWSNRVVVCKCEWFTVVRVCIVSRASEERTRVVWYVVYMYTRYYGVCNDQIQVPARLPVPGCQGTFRPKK